MNKRDRIISLMESDSVPEVIPAAFFLHFDPAYHRGDAAVAKHLEYFRRTDMDFVKIQYEHTFPVLPFLQHPRDWARMPFYDLSFYEEPLYVVKGLVRAAKPEALVILTLYSPFMLAGQAAGSQEKVVEHLQKDPEAVRKGLEIITESLRGFIRACIQAGLDGFYTSTQGGEAGRFTDPRLFETWVRPYDLTLMEEINRTCSFNILHVCDYHLPYADLTPFVNYPGHVVNCSLELTVGKMTPREAAARFGRPFMGGMDRKGVIARGSAEEIRQAVEAVCAEAPERFILGADCTLPSDTDWKNIRVAIDTAHEYRRRNA